MPLSLLQINALHLYGKLYASVIVPAYNRLEALKMCLNVLFRQTIESDKYEIIIVDDCSIDGTKEYVDQIIHTEKNMKYIRHQVNQGLACARNSGIMMAKGEYIIFLDSDIMPEADFIEKCLFYHAKYPDEETVVIGDLRFDETLTDKNNIGFYVQSRYLGFRTKREMAKIDYTNLPPRFFAGGISSLRRKTVMSVGMFDPEFKYYGGEDTDYGIRLGKHGVRLIFGTCVKAYHNDPVFLKKYKSKRIEAAREGFKIIIKKHPGCFDNTWTNLLIPINKREDPFLLRLAKLFFIIVLNPVHIAIIEYWLEKTNKYRLLYSSSLFKVAVMGWTLMGFRDANKNCRKVWSHWQET